MLTLSFEAGTLLIDGPRAQLETLEEEIPGLAFDPRVKALRAKAFAYHDLFAELYRRQKRGDLEFEDQARDYNPLELELTTPREPYPHQKEAMVAWRKAGRRGVVVLPTGAGKSYVAEMAIALVKRSSLVIAPTIDLMNQWYDILTTSFDTKVGILGGGYHEVEDLTVTTYDSFHIHMERLGARFGLLVFDEAHHLPGPSYSIAAQMAIAPYRLGLTATPERNDGQHIVLEDLIGPMVYRKRIKELSGSYLADYDIVSIRVPLSDEDGQRYQQARELYREFVRINYIRLGSAGGWNAFLRACSRSRDGRRAFRAYRLQRHIALAHAGKIHRIEGLLKRHAADRVIIFTNDNETVYKLSHRFLLPTITHRTPTKERKAVLERFNSGHYPCIVTSKVLNEGVNVPEANVAIVLSGSATVREHVQRLGRILRRGKDKRALLYELITPDTAEEFVSSRRREHDAYR